MQGSNLAMMDIINDLLATAKFKFLARKNDARRLKNNNSAPSVMRAAAGRIPAALPVNILVVVNVGREIGHHVKLI